MVQGEYGVADPDGLIAGSFFKGWERGAQGLGQEEEDGGTHVEAAHFVELVNMLVEGFPAVVPFDFIDKEHFNAAHKGGTDCHHVQGLAFEVEAGDNALVFDKELFDLAHAQGINRVKGAASVTKGLEGSRHRVVETVVVGRGEINGGQAPAAGKIDSLTDQVRDFVMDAFDLAGFVLDNGFDALEYAVGR